MNNIAEAAVALQMVLEEERYRAMASGELLAKYIDRRDEAAFAALVGRYGRLVMRRCRDVLSWEDLAQEAFQETFQQLIVNAHTVCRRGSVGPWLVATARRRALNIARREQRQRARDLGAGPQPNAPDVAQTVADREAGRIVSQSLSALPDRFRLPLELVYIDGMTHDEAAKILNWPKGTVDSYVRRGLVRLKKKLAGLGLTALAVGGVEISIGAAAVPPSLIEKVLTAAGSVSAKPSGGFRAFFDAAADWTTSKKGILVLAAVAGIVGGGLILRAAIESTKDPAPIPIVLVPGQPEESLPDKNLRLLRNVVVPMVCEALKPLAQGGGEVAAIEIEAYDSRVHCVIEGHHRQKIPGFGEKSRVALFFDSGTRETFVYLDKMANGTWNLVDLNKPLVLLRFPGLKLEWTMKLKELQQATAAFDELPRDPRAEAEVVNRRELLRGRLLTDYVGNWQREGNPQLGCRVEFVEPLGLRFWRSTDTAPFLVITEHQAWASEVSSRSRTINQDGVLGLLDPRLVDGGKTLISISDGSRWMRHTTGTEP